MTQPEVESAAAQPHPAGSPQPASPQRDYTASSLQSDYTASGVPTLDYLRDKLDRRHATALGATELAEASEPARDLERQQDERAEKARDRLEELRRALHPDA